VPTTDQPRFVMVIGCDGGRRLLSDDIATLKRLPSWSRVVSTRPDYEWRYNRELREQEIGKLATG
jgi:hypothetical protein